MISLIGGIIGGLIALGLLTIIEEVQTRFKEDREYEEIKRQHNAMVNKMFDDIDEEVQDDLDRRFKRGKYAENEDISFKYAVNPVPHLLRCRELIGPVPYEHKTYVFADDKVVEEGITYPSLKYIGR